VPHHRHLSSKANFAFKWFFDGIKSNSEAIMTRKKEAADAFKNPPPAVAVQWLKQTFSPIHDKPKSEGVGGPLKCIYTPQRLSRDERIKSTWWQWSKRLDNFALAPRLPLHELLAPVICFLIFFPSLTWNNFHFIARVSTATRECWEVKYISSLSASSVLAGRSSFANFFSSRLLSLNYGVWRETAWEMWWQWFEADFEITNRNNGFMIFKVIHFSKITAKNNLKCIHVFITISSYFFQSFQSHITMRHKKRRHHHTHLINRFMLTLKYF
jgi:hypothetical protein